MGGIILKCSSLPVMLQVNGFEVHDPEEAILLFLEQDQDITLTVARPAAKVSKGTQLPKELVWMASQRGPGYSITIYLNPLSFHCLM